MKSPTEVERGHTVQEKNILLLNGRQRCWSETLVEYPESPNTKKGKIFLRDNIALLALLA